MDLADDPFAGWTKPPIKPLLAANEVHVWGWSLAGEGPDLLRLVGLLSGDELARMRAFRFAADAERFARARAGLRTILGSYIGVAPGAIRFVYGEFGKPALAEDQGGVHFNLSHAGRWCVAAFCAIGPVGIDMEERQSVSRGIGNMMFSQKELGVLKVLLDGAFTIAFFNGWTRKEAVCKAEGLGFHLSAPAFSVSLLPGEQARIEDDGGILSRDWQFIELSLLGEVTGCVATSAASPITRLHRFDGFDCT